MEHPVHKHEQKPLGGEYNVICTLGQRVEESDPQAAAASLSLSLSFDACSYTNSVFLHLDGDDLLLL